MNHRKYYLDEDNEEFATAVAASAYAIYHLNFNEIINTGNRKEQPLVPAKAHTSGSAVRGDDKSSSSWFGRRPTTPTSIGSGTVSSKAEAQTTYSWGITRPHIAKLNERYQKMQAQIDEWEYEKKLKAKRQMERKQRELDARNSRNLEHYKAKVARIEDIANGARLQLEEKRKHHQSIPNQKLNNNHRISCFCF